MNLQNNQGGGGGLNAGQVNALISQALANFSGGLPVLSAWSPSSTLQLGNPLASSVNNANLSVVDDSSSLLTPTLPIPVHPTLGTSVFYVSYQDLTWAEDASYSEARVKVPDIYADQAAFFAVGLHTGDLSSEDFISAVINNNINKGARVTFLSSQVGGSNTCVVTNHAQNGLQESYPLTAPAAGNDLVFRFYTQGAYVAVIDATTDTQLAFVNNFAFWAFGQTLTLTIAYLTSNENTSQVLEHDASYGSSPFQQTTTVYAPIPVGASNGGGLVPIAADGTYAGKELKQGDFCLFYNGTADDEVVDVVVSRLVSDSNIRDTISTALNDPNSSLSSLVINLGGTAGYEAVVSALNEAMNYNPSDLTTSLDNFLTHLLVNNASSFYEALRTQVQDAVQGYIEDDVQNSGVIYNAIAQYVEDSTTGVAGHNIIQSAIEASLDNYANAIGVGNNGQLYLDVVEAAQATISNEIQSGGTIDAAIQAAINP